jgi:hypothetical protein
MPLDLSEVPNDPDLRVNEFVNIIRTSGMNGPGGWITNPPQTIPAVGIIAVAESRTLQQVPEGDRVTGAIQFITTTPIFGTNVAGKQTSDMILWNGSYYKVIPVEPYGHDGFYSAVLVRMKGA